MIATVGSRTRGSSANSSSKRSHRFTCTSRASNSSSPHINQVHPPMRTLLQGHPPLLHRPESHQGPRSLYQEHRKASRLSWHSTTPLRLQGRRPLPRHHLPIHDVQQVTRSSRWPPAAATTTTTAAVQTATGPGCKSARTGSLSDPSARGPCPLSEKTRGPRRRQRRPYLAWRRAAWRSRR